jgi:hypothetical protein
MIRRKREKEPVQLKGNRKDDLDRIRGVRKRVDPERGPENK